MKKYFKIFVGILATAFITTGCNSYAQSGYVNPNSGYNYNYGYGDGQPHDDYYYDDHQSVEQMPVGFNDFYNQLSPYGSWVNVAPYGRVWVANVPNFQPYSTNGYWTYTNYGWTWVSNYSWGWAPFHYGRWGYNNMYGWYWVPGYTWGPAWVAWSSGADMYGWAPLMPGMNFGVSLSVNLFPSSYWTFMPGRYMGMNNIGNYYVNRSRNVTIIKNTTIINNYGTENNRRYTMGPNANEVQRHTGRSVQQMRVTSVSDNSRAGVGNNELRVYRPVARTANASSNRSAVSSSDNNRRVAPQARTQQDQQPANRMDAQQTRSAQQTNRTDAQQTRSAQQQVNRTDAQQTRSAQQQVNRTDAQQTRSAQQQADRTDAQQTRSAQQQVNRTDASQTQTRSVQSTTRQDAGQRTYQPNPDQPKVKNAAPQTSKQIQAAQNENRRSQQQSSTAPSRSNTGGSQQRR